MVYRRKDFCGTGLPTVVRKNQLLVPRLNFGGQCAQEPTPGSTVKRCQFLDTWGGGEGTKLYYTVLYIFTRPTGERVDATMNGPSEKGDQFAVLEHMKGGQMVTHPCAPLQRIELFIRSRLPPPSWTHRRYL